MCSIVIDCSPQYTCMCIYMYGRVCMHVFIYMYVCMCCRRKYMYYGILFPILQMCVFVCVHVYVCLFTYGHVYVCMCSYICLYVL